MTYLLVGYMRVSKAGGSQVLDLQRDALLSAEVDPAHVYGVCRIACAVGLDYKSLRAKVAKSMERPGLVKPTFVQLPATMIQAEMAPIPAPGAVIEISAPDGARLRWPHGRHL